MGTIGVRHDEYHVDYKVLVRHVVGHSRPASVALTFVFFLYRYCYCYCGFVASHWFGGYVSSLCSPQGFFGFSYPAVSQFICSVLVYSGRSCLLLVRGQSSQNKPNGL